MHIKYFSTNKKSERVPITGAILSGSAPDRGLYMPDYIPGLEERTIRSFSDMDYRDTALAVTYDYLKTAFTGDELKSCIYDAYDFEVPVEKIYDNKYILYLDRGPTASFKDFAARMISRLMDHILKRDNRTSVLLTATSGDTGGAVADAFYGMDNIKGVILYPKNEVSSNQRKQMTTIGGNVKAIAVKGKFDDCQVMVKKAFADPLLKHMNLSSANSINIGRLLFQTVYYFYAYSRIADTKSKEVVFSIPSGNFGNLMGGILAKKMGLPVKKFVVAMNENDAFLSFLHTGNYKPVVPSKKCISNAMNVGHPSNLIRLINIYGGHMNEKGEIIKCPDIEKMKKDLFAVSIDDKRTLSSIKNMHKKYKIILEPHGAVAWEGMEQYLKQNSNNAPVISIETAHPAKFPAVLNRAGIYPELPSSLKKLEGKREIDKTEINDYREFIEILSDI